MLGAKMSIWPKATLSVLRRKAKDKHRSKSGRKVCFARGSSFTYVQKVLLDEPIWNCFQHAEALTRTSEKLVEIEVRRSNLY